MNIDITQTGVYQHEMNVQKQRGIMARQQVTELETPLFLRLSLLLGHLFRLALQLSSSAFSLLLWRLIGLGVDWRLFLHHSKWGWWRRRWLTCWRLYRSSTSRLRRHRDIALSSFAVGGLAFPSNPERSLRLLQRCIDFGIQLRRQRFLGR
jgi:hypothetical protein